MRIHPYIKCYFIRKSELRELKELNTSFKFIATQICLKCSEFSTAIISLTARPLMITVLSGFHLDSWHIFSTKRQQRIW